MGALWWSLFWKALHYVLSSLAIILTRKRELVALLSLSFEFLATVNALLLFHTLWFGLQFVIMVFPDLRRIFCQSIRCSYSLSMIVDEDPTKYKTAMPAGHNTNCVY